MKSLLTALFVATLAGPAFATDLSDGEIRKIDRETRKITLKHGELRTLDMPPMTMVFQVKEGIALDKLKPGDKVRFAAEKAASGYVVTEIQPAP